jgi:undecaprenyl-diphosphatase
VNRAAFLHPRGMLLIAGGAFAALALSAVLFQALPADAAARSTLLALATPAVVTMLRLANRMGEWPFILVGTGLLLVVFSRARQRWWIWATLMLVAPAAEGTLKYVVARPRPEDASFGFPSGHATAAAAFFGAVAYLAGALPPPARAIVRALAIVAIVLVGTARVVLRAHWPSDVLGGIALGLALASAAALLAARHATPEPR